VSCVKTAEPIEMPLGGWLKWVRGTILLHGGHIGRIIRSQEGWQVGDAAFRQKFFNHLLFFFMLLLLFE